MLLYSLISGIAGGLLGFGQKFVENKQKHSQEIELTKMQQEHEKALLSQNIQLDTIREKTTSNELESDYYHFLENATNTNTSSKIVNFLNGATRPLITYLDRVVFVIIFFALKESLSSQIIDELLFVVLDLIIFENAFWFGHKNSDRLFAGVDKMRSVDVKKK